MTPTTNYRRALRRPQDVLTRLRRIRRLGRSPSWRRAQLIATAQAATVAADASRQGLDPAEYIGLLPALRVERTPYVPVDAVSFYDRRANQWAIHVRSTESREVQRYAVLREFKRILDQPVIHRLYSPHADRGHQESRLAADDFARQVLMPDNALKAALRHGAADPVELGERFGISPERVTQRLIELDIGVPAATQAGGRRHG